MKNIKYIITFLSLALFFSACEEDNNKFGDLIAPSNVEIAAPVIIGQDLNNPELENGDGTGLVTFTTTASNVISYNFNFGDGSSEVVPSGVVTHRYTKVGVNTFTVIVSAIGTGGVTSTTSVDVTVYSSFSDVEAEDILSGGVIGESKKWYWAANLPLHVGMGTANDDYGNGEFAFESWWNAIQPWDAEKGCMYDDEFVFTKTADGITFEQTGGPAFIPGTYAGFIGADGDTCSDETVATTMYGVKNVALFPSGSKAALEGAYDGNPYRGTAFEISNGGFMGWYVGSSTYDIISMDENYMRVRIEEDPATGVGAAWYQLFTSTKPDPDAGNESAFTDLVWEDDFETAGAPDETKWAYDLGDDGWGNQEVQNYTKDAANVIVADGVLKITAIKETDGTYTSARLKTQGLYDFKYGRVDISAKLPAFAGTWPALWMLGDNINVVGWPQCGEIDIMEQTGDDKDTTLGTFHWWDTTNKMYGETLAVADASTEFHLYSLEWTEEKLTISVDGSMVVEMDNSVDLPFNENFFLVLNVAMGGTLGGDIDPAFTQDVMEIEYVEVYQ